MICRIANHTAVREVPREKTEQYFANLALQTAVYGRREAVYRNRTTRWDPPPMPAEVNPLDGTQTGAQLRGSRGEAVSPRRQQERERKTASSKYFMTNEYTRVSKQTFAVSVANMFTH